MSQIKIAIADSQMLTNEGIFAILKRTEKFDIISNLESTDELFEFLKIKTPSILIIDPDQFKKFIFTDFIKLTEIYPPSRILVLTNKTDKDFILKILELGITHFLLKNSLTNILLEALASIEKNEKFLCQEAIEILLNEKLVSVKNGDSHLTKKELEIIRLLAQGLTTKDIATRIFLSIHTVNTHRKNILNKLNINNTSELIMYAVRTGIVDTMEYYI